MLPRAPSPRPAAAGIALLCLPFAVQAQDVCAEATLHLGAPTPEARLGWSVAIDGTTAIVGAPFGDGAAALSGLVKVYERGASGWVEVDTLTSSDGLGGDGFGNELSIDGDRMVIGSVWSDGPGVDSGAVYVFDKVAGVWTESAKLTPSDHAPQDWFGRAVDLDGDRLIVGASLKANPAFAQGATYVFERVGGSWIETAKLSASDGAGDDFFGGALALDGDRILVGAHGADDLAAESGGGYIFDKVGATWVEQPKLIAADGQANDDLGIEVALEGDVAILTAFGDDDAAVDGGAAYVFTRGVGGVWSEHQELHASDATAGHGLGSGVGMDGDLLAVGAQEVDVGGAQAGRVYSFQRDPVTGLFAEIAQFDGAPPGGLLGFDVALSGKLIVGGAPESPAVGTAAGEVWMARLAAGDTLFGCPEWVPLGAGGTQTLTLDLDAAHAGDLYFVAGSTSGSAPGFVFGGVPVPLNPDSFFLYTVSHPNTPPYQATLGNLDGAGDGQAAIALPPGADPTLAGALLVHAALILDPVLLTASAATNAAPIQLLP